MPFTGDVYALPAGSLVSNGVLSDASQHNTPLEDIEDVLSDVAARITGKQPLDTDLTAIAALTSAANKMPYATGAGTWALADLTSAGRAILDDASADAQLVTLGGSDAGVDGFKFDFDTAALLIADTVRTYSNTTAGDYIRTRSEGFAYEVAASGASDHHVTTGGGLKLYVLRDKLGAFPAAAFGLLAANSASANNAILANCATALASGGTLAITVPGTYDFSDATISADDVTLFIGPKVILRQTVLDAFGLKLTGDRASIIGFGGGSIKSNVTVLGDYASTGSGIARAIVKMTGDDPTIDGLVITTPSRCGVFVEDGKRLTVKNCSGDGGWAYADYNSATTLNLYAVYYDIPAAAGMLSMRNNRFSNYITPLAAASFGIAGDAMADIVGNEFTNCYDHGGYFYNLAGGEVSGNKGYDCRKIFAVGGTKVSVHGNYSYASGTSQSNHEAGMSFRDATDLNVHHNTLWGVGAYLDCATFTASQNLTGNRFEDNILTATAQGELAANIRITNTDAGTISGNSIRRNQMTNLSTSGTSQGVIYINGNSTGRGYDNIIEANTLNASSTIYLILCQYVDALVIDRNTIERTHTAGGAVTLDNIYLPNCASSIVRRNRHVYRTGGTNVTCRGINIPASSSDPTIEDEIFDWHGAGLTARSPLVNSATGVTTRRRIVANPTVAMQGDATLTSAAGQTIVNNANIFDSSVRVLLTPTDANGAAIMATPGMWVQNDSASSRFQIKPSTGTWPSTGTVTWQIQ